MIPKSHIPGFPNNTMTNDIDLGRLCVPRESNQFRYDLDVVRRHSIEYYTE